MLETKYRIIGSCIIINTNSLTISSIILIN
nr:MAG TPA: hypothetical protein [Caudoviricetes sp.]